MTNGKVSPPLKPKRAFGRSLEDFGKLYPAEEQLKEAVAKGEPCDVRLSFDDFHAALPDDEKFKLFATRKELRKKYSDDIEFNSAIFELLQTLDFPRPIEATDANHVRAGFLRFLALGGDAQTPIHKKGVELRGAFIEGGLDLQGGEVIRPLALIDCWFDTQLILRGARLRSLNLYGSRFPGLDGAESEFAGSLSISNVLAQGPVWLHNAEISGSLECVGGSFKNRTDDGQGRALTCEGAKITGSVLLRYGFTAEGQVSLLGAEIGGALECDGGSFKNRTKDGQGQALNFQGAKITGSVLLRNSFAAEGEVWLMGAEIGGNLECFGGSFKNCAQEPKEPEKEDGGSWKKVPNALVLINAAIKDALWLGPDDTGPAESAIINGSVNLEGTRAGQLIDHSDAWPPEEIEGPDGEELRGTIVLDGFTYDRIAGGAPCDAKTRKSWLLRQPPEHLGKEFRPQPYEQLIKVLRAMGHEEDARKIAIFKQEQMIPGRVASTFPALVPFRWIWLQFLRYSVGFGYRLWPLFVFVVALWLASVAIYSEAARQGVFAPSRSPVFQENLENCRPTKDRKLDCSEIPADEFTYFNPWIYSADVMLPIIKLNQKDEWAPLRREWTWGPLTFEAGFVRGWVWFEIIVGWFGSLLLASVLTGIVKKD